MAEGTPPPFQTFRDPAGSVQVAADAVRRVVREPYASEFAEFLGTPIAAQLVASGQIVGSEVVSSTSDDLHLRHPLIHFISYPWEWPAGLWLEAAELTLHLCSELLKAGWQLKDATPLNILFQGTTPILVDVLSIEKAKAGEAMWKPYGQFIRTFLLPLLAYSRLGWPLQTTQIRRDGFEPEEIYRALGWFQKLQSPARSAVAVPVLLGKLSGSRKTGGGSASASVMDAEIATRILLRRLDGLRRSVRKSLPKSRGSAWKQYVETATHYPAEDHELKKKFVTEALRVEAPRAVLDVGCNTGVYSRLAADLGARVVSIDSDMQALERLYTEAKASARDILPLCVDIAYPTPALGWENRESRSFLERCEGAFDAVLMLAVIHHLLLSSQIPLEHIAALCSRITRRALVLEWVPPTDVKFVEVLRGREAIYRHITEDAMRAAFAVHFSVASEVTLSNGRILFHFVRKPNQ